MSLELKRECVKTGKRLKEASSEQRIDMDITLPDYCADIKKILRCTLVPGVHTVSLSGEKVSAKGSGTVRVIYLAEGDKTDVFEKSCDMSSSVQLKDISPESVVTAKAVTDFVNCRAVSQRKISVSAGVSTIFSCFGAENEFFAVEDPDKSIQVKKEKLSCESHLGFFEKTFDLTETVVLNSEHPPVGKIVSCSCRIQNQTHKLSAGKLLIKADAVTDICYIPEKGENEFHSFSHSMPVSQIIDVRDIPDSAFCTVGLNVCQQLCSHKADSSGSNRLVDIALRVSAFIKAYEKKDCDVITDCYCTDFETKESFEESGILCPIRKVSEQRQVKGEIEFSAPVKSICFAKCLEISKNIRYGEENAVLDCSALVFIMYLDDKGVPCCCEKNLDFEFSYPLAQKCTQAYGEFSIDGVTLTAAVTSEDKAELSLGCEVKGCVCCKFEKKILKSLSVYEDKPKDKNDAALTLYFTEKGEKLWDIARSHNTTVELIIEENGLKSENLKENSMLLIPCR